MLHLDTDNEPTDAQLDAIEASERLTCGLCRYSTQVGRGPQARDHAWKRLRTHGSTAHDIEIDETGGDHRSIVDVDPAEFHAIDDPDWSPRSDLVAFVTTITPRNDR
jgi:hypothetical protein